jgi:hypothetical protein
MRINLASMPAAFWTHVNSDGSDIRVTNSLNVSLPFAIENFNFTAKTGDLWVNTGGTLYIYYGNPDATAIANGSGIANEAEDVFQSTSQRFAFNFADNVVNQALVSEDLTTAPTYVDGLFGKAAFTYNSTIQTANNSNEARLTGPDLTVSFLVYVRALPASDRQILYENNTNWTIKITTTGKIAWFVNGAGGSITVTSTAGLTPGNWYVIDCTYEDDYFIYINGVKETFVDNNGDFVTSGNNSLLIKTFPEFYLSHVWGFNNDLTDNQVTTKYNNFTNASFWTYGSEEAMTSVNLTYDGVHIYTKSITSGNWEDYLVSGQPARSTSYHPVNGFVESNSDLYFIVSGAADYTGFHYLGKTDTFNLLEPQHLLLTSYSTANPLRLVPHSDSPVDKSIYFTYGSSNLGEAADPGNTAAFAAYSNIASITPWRNYLAIGSTRRTRANVEIWDLVQANPIEFIDAGTGNLRVVGNASDTLFAVVDNYIDDSVLSSNQPTMEIREYMGNGLMESTIKMSVPAVYTTLPDTWEKPVSTFTVRRNDETLFYARIPANATATEFYEGLWAVGKNEDGKLALSLMIDTSDLGIPENIYGFAKQIFFIQKDGGIKRLATDGTYDHTTLYRTLEMNEGNTEIEKKLHGIEVVTEPLEAGQTISIYYKKNGDSNRTLIAEFSGENEIAMEAVTDADGNNLPHYQEIHFDIESTGGSSAILEFNYRFEYLSDLV